MADNLPEPKSRKESYLAKAAGMDVTIPEAPESRTEQYLAAIAEGGGGGGGTSDFNELTNRPKYNGTAMTGDTNIPLVENGAKQLTSADYDYPTDSPDGVALWLIEPGLYRSEGVKVYYSKTSASSLNGRSLMVFRPAEGYTTDIIDIYGGGGLNTYTWYKTMSNGNAQIIGNVPYASFLTGANVQTSPGNGPNPISQNAATLMAEGTTTTRTIETSAWTALSGSSPYTYQATIASGYSIGANTVVELLNDDPVLFANYGFAIGAASGNNLTIYSIGQPSASVSLKVNYKDFQEEA